jgi:hypothetical protein
MKSNDIREANRVLYNNGNELMKIYTQADCLHKATFSRSSRFQIHVFANETYDFERSLERGCEFPQIKKCERRIWSRKGMGEIMYDMQRKIIVIAT